MKQVNKNRAKGWQTEMNDGIAYIADTININRQANKPIDPVKYVPPQGTNHFIGRSQELTKIHTLLYQQQNTVAISAVAGMGGVGKTELAIKYALAHKDDYPGGICWLNAIDGNLATEIIQFARRYLNLKVPQKDTQGNPLSITQQVAWCWSNWQPSQGLVLIIFDDVNNKEDWSVYLPKNNRFQVLITSRLQQFDFNIKKIALDVFSLDEALEILINMVGSRKINRELETAKELCQWFRYLPLGVELAGRYIANRPPHVRLAKILEELKQQQLEQDIKNPTQKNLITTQRSVKVAFELSWLELDEQTRRIAAILSLFAENIFAWGWVESVANSLNCRQDDAGEVLEELYRRHLVNSVESADTYYYKLHPLIREFLEEKLKEFAEVNEFKKAFTVPFIEIARSIPQSATLEQINSVKNAIPHLAFVAENFIHLVSDENVISPFLGLVRFYNAQGLYALAEPWCQQCVSVVKSRLGENHQDYATSLNSLAYLYYNLRKYDEAEKLYIKALELTKHILGENHPNYASSLNNLASLYDKFRKFDEAELLYIQALELRKRIPGENHSDCATSLNNLALLYYNQGKYNEAEPLYIQALELTKRIPGENENQLNYASSLNNLASLYYNQGKYNEAEALHTQALGLRKRILGENHQDYATSLNNLASLYHNQGKYNEAEPLYMQALSIYEQRLDTNHPLTNNCRQNLENLRSAINSKNSTQKPLAQSLYDSIKQILSHWL